LSYYYNQ